MNSESSWQHVRALKKAGAIRNFAYGKLLLGAKNNTFVDFIYRINAMSSKTLYYGSKDALFSLLSMRRLLSTTLHGPFCETRQLPLLRPRLQPSDTKAQQMKRVQTHCVGSR